MAPLNVGGKEPVHAQFEPRSLLSRRSLAATGLFVAAVAVVATTPSLVGHRLSGAWGGLEAARPIWLWAAAGCFVASLLGSAWAWRSAVGLCGGRLSRPDAAARYSIGSLVNGISPA